MDRRHDENGGKVMKGEERGVKRGGGKGSRDREIEEEKTGEREEIHTFILHLYIHSYTLNCRNAVVYIYTNIQISNEMQNVRNAKIQLFKHKIVLKSIVLALLDLILI